MGQIADISELLNIGALAQAVDIPAETLRTWERRYGFPTAKRTPSGHRRYSPDVRERLLLVKELLAQGHRPSTVLSWSLDRLEEELGQRAGVSTARAQAKTGLSNIEGDELVEQALARSRRYDASGFDQILRRAWSEQGASSFISNFMCPLLERVGDAWAQGSITVAQEHFSSERVRIFLAERWRPLAEANNGPLAVFATLPGEHHVLGLHMLTLLAAVGGARVSFLGADTPVSQLALAAREQFAASVAVSISSSAQVSEVRRALSQLRQELGQIPLIAGGRGAPDGVVDVHVERDLFAACDWILATGTSR
jgi:methanogenic corrinoid protein MtbC1